VALTLKHKKIPAWKVEEVEELVNLIKNNKTILIGSLEEFPSDKLHEIRKKLRGKAVIKVTKNTLFEIAAKKAGIDIDKIKGYLTGPNVFIFTNDKSTSLPAGDEQEGLEEIREVVQSEIRRTGVAWGRGVGGGGGGKDYH
jgi:hypothetical protein